MKWAHVMWCMCVYITGLLVVRFGYAGSWISMGIMDECTKWACCHQPAGLEKGRFRSRRSYLGVSLEVDSPSSLWVHSDLKQVIQQAFEHNRTSRLLTMEYQYYNRALLSEFMPKVSKPFQRSCRPFSLSRRRRSRIKVCSWRPSNICETSSHHHGDFTFICLH